MAIGHIPVAVVNQNFNMLVRDRSTRRLVNRFQALDDFMTYISNTYTRGTFPIPMWNVNERKKKTVELTI